MHWYPSWHCIYCEFVGWISTPGPASVNTGQEQCLKEEGMKELSGNALEVFKKSLPVVPGMSGGAWLCISDAAVGRELAAQGPGCSA